MIYAFANRLVAENTNRFAKKWVGFLRFNKIIAKALFEKYIRSIVYFVTFLDAMKSGLKESNSNRISVA